jgi:hypothetical protein
MSSTTTRYLTNLTPSTVAEKTLIQQTCLHWRKHFQDFRLATVLYSDQFKQTLFEGGLAKGGFRGPTTFLRQRCTRTKVEK